MSSCKYNLIVELRADVAHMNMYALITEKQQFIVELLVVFITFQLVRNNIKNKVHP